MPLSKTQIALYLALAAAVVLTLTLKLPHWLLIVFAACTGVVELRCNRRDPVMTEQPSDTRWPWQTGSFWVVLALFLALGTVLAIAGTSAGIIVFVCGLALAFYAYDIAKRIELKRMLLRGRPRLTAGVEEWTLLSVSVGLCLSGLLISQDDWRSGVVTITLFGTSALIFLATILRKRREHRLRRATVRVTGGVNIYVQGMRIVYMAVGCCGVGAVMYFVGTDYPLLFRFVAAFILLVGVGLGIAIALGVYTQPYIRFDPDAFVVRERTYLARIPWDDIVGIWTFEYAHNPFVGIKLAYAVTVRVEPRFKAPAFLRHVGVSRGLMKADLALAPRNFGIDSVVLAGALHRYSTQPDARDELIARNRVAGPT